MIVSFSKGTFGKSHSSIEGEPNAKLLEIHIPRMPPPPTDWYRNRIREDFPLIGYRLYNEALSAVLFSEVRETDGEKP